MLAAKTRNVFLLTLSQALGNSSSSMVVLTGGILGAKLAPTATLATMPIFMMVVGTSTFTIPAALLMRWIGRKKGYIAGAATGFLAALLAVFAIFKSTFWLLSGAMLLIGFSNAFVKQYRFGAAESVPPERSSQAVGFVLLGGGVAGLLGPEVAKFSEDLLPGGEFGGSFLILAFFFVLVMLLLTFLDEIVVHETKTISNPEPRSIIKLFSQPKFLMAVFAGIVAYGVMSFIMSATTLEMHDIMGFSLPATTVVIQTLYIARYLPSLVTGYLLSRLGERRIMLLGVLCLLGCVGLSFISKELFAYWGALVLLGIGWNLLFIAATVLLTRSYEPNERFNAQAINDFAIFGIRALTSLFAGVILFQASWDVLLLLNIPVLIILFALTITNRSLFTESSPQFKKQIL